MFESGTLPDEYWINVFRIADPRRPDYGQIIIENNYLSETEAVSELAQALPTTEYLHSIAVTQTGDKLGRHGFENRYIASIYDLEADALTTDQERQRRQSREEDHNHREAGAYRASQL